MYSNNRLIANWTYKSSFAEEATADEGCDTTDGEYSFAAGSIIFFFILLYILPRAHGATGILFFRNRKKALKNEVSGT